MNRVNNEKLFFLDAFTKCINVIESCLTFEQLYVAEKLVENFNFSFPKNESYINYLVKKIKYKKKILRLFCPHCNKSKNLNDGFLEYVEGIEPYCIDHYMCNKCDSTFVNEDVENGNVF